MLEKIKNGEEKVKGIIFSGGPASVYEKGAPTVNPEVFNLNLPILGICYGMQLITHLNGGKWRLLAEDSRSLVLHDRA